MQDKQNSNLQANKEMQKHLLHATSLLLLFSITSGMFPDVKKLTDEMLDDFEKRHKIHEDAQHQTPVQQSHVSEEVRSEHKTVNDGSGSDYVTPGNS